MLFVFLVVLGGRMVVVDTVVGRDLVVGFVIRAVVDSGATSEVNSVVAGGLKRLEVLVSAADDP